MTLPKPFMMAAVAAALACSCSTKEMTTHHQTYRDTVANVYGPYIVYKLPIDKGIRMGNPIQLALGPGGKMFASNQTGEVYTLEDSDGDGFEDSAALYCDVRKQMLRSPAGLAFKGDTVFVGTASEIRAYLDIDRDGGADTSWTFFGGIPQSEHPYEWTSGLNFDADGWLYCALTTDSWNAGAAKDPNGMRGSIIRISPDGKRYERLATGIRSVPGMSFNDRGELFFVDNEGGGNPTEELNLLRQNSFYGHNKKKFPKDSGAVARPRFDLQAEVAPSSIEFNRTAVTFGGNPGDLFVSYYGPGERWTRGSVGRVTMTRDASGEYKFQEFTMVDIPKVSDLAFSSDGSLYVAHHGEADYWYNAIYKDQGGFFKIVYDPSIPKPANYVRVKEQKTFSKNSLEMGKQLFAELGCLACHHVDGTTELLGPNLKDAGRNYSRNELLEEILQPSARIKPSMGGMKILKKDGTELLGRVLSADDQSVNFILVGNQVLNLQRTDIAKMEDVKKSLMFEGLLYGASEEQRNALLDYIISLSGTVN